MKGSLRRTLLVGILLPVFALVVFNAVGLYRQALEAADTAYDRTLLASAKSIGELLEVDGPPGQPRLRGTVLYSALEAFEADNRSRIYYKVTGFAGELVSGFEDLPAWRGEMPVNNVYAALVHFYDEVYRGEPVRVAVLLQPVAGLSGQGMATIQVAETLELRRRLARQLLADTLWRQLALLVVIVAVVLFVVQAATRPVRELSAQLEQRPENDLSALDATAAPRELRPMLVATNALMARLAHLLEHQKRFVRDASHQLRTPLAVLKTQVQSARRGDLPPADALREIGETVEHATEVANQMLALAKVEQLHQQGNPPTVDWDPIVRHVSLQLAPLIAERRIDFELSSAPCRVRAHEWALRELTRNLLHNAVKYAPAGSALRVGLAPGGGRAEFAVDDEGPGLAPEVRDQLFRPFAASAEGGGSGLGLAICAEIVRSLQGTIDLGDRVRDGRREGLRASVHLPLAEAA